MILYTEQEPPSCDDHDDGIHVQVPPPSHHDDDHEQQFYDVLQAASSISTMRKRQHREKQQVNTAPLMMPSFPDHQRVVLRKRPLTLLTSFDNSTSTESKHPHHYDDLPVVGGPPSVMGGLYEHVTYHTNVPPPTKKFKIMKRSEKKTVHFANTVQVAYCDGEHIDHHSKSFGLIWYTHEDYESFKDECRLTLFQIDSSSRSSSPRSSPSSSPVPSYCSASSSSSSGDEVDDLEYDENEEVSQQQSTSYKQFDHNQFCIRGLEEQITPETYHARKSRKEYFIRSILNEQDRQRVLLGGLYEPENFKLISSIQSKQCIEFALELAKLDATIHDE